MSEHSSSEQRKLKILVVDDRYDAAKMLALLFRASGHEVQTAKNGQAALEQVQQFQPEVALLDIGLPDMDGCEVARRIRGNPNLASMRLIALTGWGADQAERIKEAGFDRHVTKPVEPEELMAMLDDLVGGVE